MAFVSLLCRSTPAPNVKISSYGSARGMQVGGVLSVRKWTLWSQRMHGNRPFSPEVCQHALSARCESNDLCCMSMSPCATAHSTRDVDVRGDSAEIDR